MERLLFSLWKFDKFLMSFLKPQVSFPSNFTSTLFSAIKHNPSVLFYLKQYIQGTNQNVNFLFWLLESIFIKLLVSILKRNFTSFLAVMTHNSSVKFKLINFLLWIKGYYQSPNFVTLECSVVFQTTSQFFVKFCITLYCHKR